MEIEHSAATEEEHDKKPVVLAAIFVIGIFFFHATRTLNFYPITIPDEFTYNFDSRLRDPANVEIPNYLYYFFIRICDLFGSEYYNAVKIINSLLYVLAAPFAYKVARMVCGRTLSLYLCVAVILWPFSVFTAQFWPEPIYSTAIWIFFWLLLKYDRFPPVKQGLLAGVCMALLSLIKVHGIFLLPGYLIFAATTFPRDSTRDHVLNVAKSFLAAAFVFCVVKLGLGYLLAGTYGLTLFGTSYNSLADDGTQAILSMGKLVLDSIFNLGGHLLVASLAIALPIIAVGYVFLGRTAAPPPLKRLCCVAVSFIVPLMFVSSGFSAMLEQLFPGEAPAEVTRIQDRYYSFIYPVFLVVAGGVMSILDAGAEARFRREKWLCLLLAGMSTYAAFTNFHGYCVVVLEDYVEGAFLQLAPGLPLAIAALAITACLLVLKRAQSAFRLYLFGFFPLFAAASLAVLHMGQTMRFGVYPLYYDKGGIFAREYLGDEIADLAVVDRWLHNGKKAMFHMNNGSVTLHPHFDTDDVDMSRIPPGKKWILSFGKLKVPAERDKYHIEYVDPGLDNELWERMIRENKTRFFLGYDLIRIADFDYSHDFSANRAVWPVRETGVKNTRFSIFYAKDLPRNMRITLETPDDFDGAVFSLKAGERSLGLLESGKEKSVVIPRNTTFLTFEPRDNRDAFAQRLALKGLAGFKLRAYEQGGEK